MENGKKPWVSLGKVGWMREGCINLPKLTTEADPSGIKGIWGGKKKAKDGRGGGGFLNLPTT